MIQEHHFHRKIQNNKKVIDFDLFFGHDRDLTPPPVPLLGGSWDRLRMWFLEGHLASWLDQLTWHAVTRQVIWRGGRGEGEKSTWQAQRVKLTYQVPLVFKRKCRTLNPTTDYGAVRSRQDSLVRGGRFNLLLTPMGGWVWHRKIFSYREGGFWWYRNLRIWMWGQIFECWRLIFEFWRYMFEFCHHVFEFWRHIFEFWRQNWKHNFFEWCGGGPNNRKNWRLEQIRDSGTKPVILKYCRCTTYCKQLATAGDITQQNHNCMMN